MTNNKYKQVWLLLLLINTIFSQKDIAELKEDIEHVCDEPTHKHYDRLTLTYTTPW